jgi:hypothetical protein
VRTRTIEAEEASVARTVTKGRSPRRYGGDETAIDLFVLIRSNAKCR